MALLPAIAALPGPGPRLPSLQGIRECKPCRSGEVPCDHQRDADPRMNQEKCPICGGVSARLMGQKDGLRVLRCGTCTVQYSEHAPEVSELRAVQQGVLPWVQHGLSGVRGRRIPPSRTIAGIPQRPHGPLRFARIAARCRVRHRILSRRGAPGGVGSPGLEVSEWAATSARRRFGLDVVQAPFPTALLGPRRYERDLP